MITEFDRLTGFVDLCFLSIFTIVLSFEIKKSKTKRYFLITHFITTFLISTTNKSFNV